MKHFFYSLLFLALSGIGFGSQAQAQCVPDTSFTNPGIYPSTIPDACANIPYATVLTLVVPVDTLVSTPIGPLTVPIDSLVLDTAIGIPPGLVFSCNPASCVFLGGSTNCILISGTATTADTFSVDISIVTYATVFGNVVPVPSNVNYTFIVNPGMTNTVSVTDASCGANDGSATVSSSGATPFTYSWSTGDTSATASNLAAGLETVTIIDANGCSETLSVTINNTGNPPSLDLDFVSWTGCAGSMGGDITVTTLGGTAPFTYTWSNGTTTEDLSGVAGGTYTLTVTDSAGCQDVASFTLTEPAALSLSLGAVSDVSCAGDADGSASVTVSGGLAPYTYSWATTPAQSTSMISSLSGGSYTLFVTDSLGCVEDISATIVEPDPLTWTLSSTNETSFDLKDGTAGIVVQGGTGAYTYSWSNGESGSEIDSLAPGTYTITVTDANNCSFTDSLTIVGVSVSIEDELNMGIQEFTLFPNPSSIGQLTVRIGLQNPEHPELRILSMRGELVRQLKPGLTQQWQETISLNGLASGIYLVQLRTAQGTASRKLVVQ